MNNNHEAAAVRLVGAGLLVGGVLGLASIAGGLLWLCITSAVTGLCFLMVGGDNVPESHQSENAGVFNREPGTGDFQAPRAPQFNENPPQGLPGHLLDCKCESCSILRNGARLMSPSERYMNR